MTDPLLTLFIEDLIADLIRFTHLRDGHRPDEIHIRRESQIGPLSFADVEVHIPNTDVHYYVEVDHGYSDLRIINSLKRKYSRELPAKMLVLALPSASATLLQEVTDALHTDMSIEIWDTDTVLRRVHDFFSIKVTELSIKNLDRLRTAVAKKKWDYAFAGLFANHKLRRRLLWHYGFWQLKNFHDHYGATPDDILVETTYSEAVVLMSDLCSFSSYVRDTSNERTARLALTGFYSKARYAVINNGGMLYQFVGDEVIGVFGIPFASSGDPVNALQCANEVSSIGDSVSADWQRSIDRVQSSQGTHTGIGIGSLTLLGLRPYSPGDFGVFGDTINMSARLCTAADSGDIVISNTVRNKLPANHQKDCEKLEPLEAKNMGRIFAWRYNGHRADESM